MLDGFGNRIAILNCLYAVQTLFSEDMGAALARAVNNWVAKEWLDRDPRLRASIVVPIQNAEMAAIEIDCCAADRRFVQVLLPCLDQPLGRRLHWPIYEAAQRHGLPVAIHAGSTYRHLVTPVGWPSTFTEDYVAQAQGFQTQLTSLVCEVLSRFPDLAFVFAESGFTWLPSYLWRLTKYWHGLRMEIPWVDQPPADLIRRQVRFTLQPVDAPPDSDDILRVIEHVGSEELLLFSTDYPHWQSDEGDDPFPSFSAALRQKLLWDNPLQNLCPHPGGFCMNIEVAQRTESRRQGAADHRRLRHSSGTRQALRHLAVFAEALARARADLWPAAAATAFRAARPIRRVSRMPRGWTPGRPTAGRAAILRSCSASISTPTMSSLAS
jgi:predicted TIM-barrel fold metal-dependent hydrolase